MYRVNSFFAGIGGFDLGFEKSGFKTEYLCEINPFCNEVLSTHWSDVRRATDICEVRASDIPDAEVWCGGFPCQDISVARGASQRLGLGGTRSGLFYQFADLIEEKTGSCNYRKCRGPFQLEWWPRFWRDSSANDFNGICCGVALVQQ